MVDYLCESDSEFNASSVNSRLSVMEIVSPGSTIPPGIAHSLSFFRKIATNINIGFPLVESIILFFVDSSVFHLVKTGSAAWFGPHFPSSPRPLIPVRPMGLMGIASLTWYDPSKDTRSVFPSRALNLISEVFEGSAHEALASSGAFQWCHQIFKHDPVHCCRMCVYELSFPV